MKYLSMSGVLILAAAAAPDFVVLANCMIAGRLSYKQAATVPVSPSSPSSKAKWLLSYQSRAFALDCRRLFVRMKKCLWPGRIGLVESPVRIRAEGTFKVRITHVLPGSPCHLTGRAQCPRPGSSCCDRRCGLRGWPELAGGPGPVAGFARGARPGQDRPGPGRRDRTGRGIALRYRGAAGATGARGAGRVRPAVSPLVSQLAGDLPRALKGIRSLPGRGPGAGVGAGRGRGPGRWRRAGDRRPGRRDRDHPLSETGSRSYVEAVIWSVN